MAVTIKSLAQGQLPNAKGTLYTAAGQVIVRRINLVNTGAGINSVNVYKKTAAGTSKRIIPVALALDPGDQAICIEDDVMTLETGDLIEGDATNASEVDYVIDGVTRS
ncbi:MAG: hypothetical protein QG615_828 [Nitrospirota bacterium]|nr:hypothetical protein [Nitrospirota bacterium]